VILCADRSPGERRLNFGSAGVLVSPRTGAFGLPTLATRKWRAPAARAEQLAHVSAAIWRCRRRADRHEWRYFFERSFSPRRRLRIIRRFLLPIFRRPLRFFGYAIRETSQSDQGIDCVPTSGPDGLETERIAAQRAYHVAPRQSFRNDGNADATRLPSTRRQVPNRRRSSGLHAVLPRPNPVPFARMRPPAPQRRAQVVRSRPCRGAICAIDNTVCNRCFAIASSGGCKEAPVPGLNRAATGDP